MNDPRTGGDEYCEVYDEPRHRFHLRNDYTNIYEIQLPQNCATYFHRHCEDTVYFVIADAEVRESFRNKPATLTTAHAGGTLCRSHKDEPLIHQVTNIGAGVMHMIGAEALARPRSAIPSPMQLDAHSLVWTSKRFRTYDVRCGDAAARIEYGVYGLLVALTECDLFLPQQRSQGRAHVGLRAGAYVWVEPPLCLDLPPLFDGIFAEWI